MHSRWGMVDSLMREIGALRNEARALDPRTIDEKLVADIDRVIADAAQAIDETIAEPEEESRLIGACEAIIVARLDCGVELSVQGARDSLELVPGRQVWVIVKTHSCHLLAG